MKITLKDRTEILVDNERGKKLMKILSDGDAPEYIVIDEVLVRKDFIVKIQPSSRAEQIIKSDRQLKEPDYRGEDSKNKETLKELIAKKNFKALRNM